MGLTLTRCYNFCCDPFDLGVIAHVCNLNLMVGRGGREYGKCSVSK